MLQQAEALGKAEDKYVYFLLGVAGAAIGCAAYRTANLKLSETDWVLFWAVASWAGSFLAGCFNRKGRMWGEFSSLASQGLMLAMEAEEKINPTNKHLCQAKELVDDAVKFIDKDGKQSNKLAQFCDRVQLPLLAFGALLYLIWHVVKMAA